MVQQWSTTQQNIGFMDKGPIGQGKPLDIWNKPCLIILELIVAQTSFYFLSFEIHPSMVCS